MEAFVKLTKYDLFNREIPLYTFSIHVSSFHWTKNSLTALLAQHETHFKTQNWQKPNKTHQICLGLVVSVPTITSSGLLDKNP